jgi:hypothetical protein
MRGQVRNPGGPRVRNIEACRLQVQIAGREKIRDFKAGGLEVSNACVPCVRDAETRDPQVKPRRVSGRQLEPTRFQVNASRVCVCDVESGRR